MKRFVSFLLCLCVITSVLCTIPNVCSASALETETADERIISQTVTELPDGNSVLITISESPTATYATSYTKSASKSYTLRNSDGEALWQFSIRGTFRVTTGVSAVCTNVTHSYSITDDAWHYVSGSSYYTGNKAVGNAEFNRKLLLITVETRQCQVTLTCDTNGNLT